MLYPEAYRKLIQRIGASISVPKIVEILLPRNAPASEREDEFGFVILEDDSVICTASTLINGTIEEILSAAGPKASIDIIGPSASGLPDPLFDRGVGSVGGIVIDRPGQLREALINGEKWGDCGRKYQLGAENYPGVETLLARIRFKYRPPTL